MSNTTAPLLTGMALGGAVIAAIGAGSTMYVEEKKPSAKSLSRDFIIGAVMVAMIMQLLPESTTSVIQYLLALAPLSLFKSAPAAIAESVAAATASSSEDMEVKVGVPRF
jgi:hypothetical protein